MCVGECVVGSRELLREGSDPIAEPVKIHCGKRVELNLYDAAFERKKDALEYFADIHQHQHTPLMYINDDRSENLDIQECFPPERMTAIEISRLKIFQESIPSESLGTIRLKINNLQSLAVAISKQEGNSK